MAGTDSPQSGLTRRSFLKTTGVVTGALSLAGVAGMTTASDWLAPSEAHAEEDEKIVYTLHQFMCQGMCSLKCTIRDGRLAMIQPNDTVDDYYQHVCLKGISEIQHVYSSERLQSPMRRVGERGEGKFEVITWDEAMDAVGSEIKKIWDKYGKSSVYISASNEPRFSLLAPLLGAGTGVEPGIDRGVGNGEAPALNGDGFGGGTSESRDWVNTKTLIMSGANLLESSLMQANALLDAKEAGCDIIVLDPHFSTTASKATEWIPIKPGTDPAFFLAMTSYVLDNKLYDEEYMRAHTTFPFLVDENTGELLLSDPSIEDSFLVWDTASGSAVLHSSNPSNPALEGTFEVNGRRCTTTFELLKKNQKQYTAKWASEITGIDAEKIEEIADKYATKGPGYLTFGLGGIDKYSNPDIAGHAAITLTALTGNIGKPGCGIGCNVGGSGYGVSLGEWPLPEEFVSPELPVRADRFTDQENDVHAIISLGNTFQQYWANMNKTEEWIDSLDFILHVGMYNEDTVRYADIVLPVCSKFEDTVEHSIVRSDYNHVNLQTKCIDPLFESKPDFDVMKLIAESVGLGDHLPKDAEELVRYQIEHSDDLKEQGITLDALVKNHGSIPMEGIKEPRRGFADQVFPTDTGRMEVYYEAQAHSGQAWPNWEQNNEAYEGSPLSEKYPIQFTQTRTRFSNHSHFKAATWLRQYVEPTLEMNPKDMEERGIVDGDMVKASNDRGSFECTVRANESIRPGSSRTFEAGWGKYIDNGNTQNVTNDHVNPRDKDLLTGAPIPFNDTLIQVEKA